MTLDCPLFIRKVCLQDTEVITHSDSGFASVYYLRVRQAALLSKPESELQHLRALIVPPLLDSFATKIANTMGCPPPEPFIEPPKETPQLHDLAEEIVTTNIAGWTCISNLQYPISLGVVSLEEEVKYCFAVLKGTFWIEMRNRLLTKLVSRSSCCPALANEGHSQYKSSHLFHGGLPPCQRRLSEAFLFSSSCEDLCCSEPSCKEASSNGSHSCCSTSSGIGSVPTTQFLTSPKPELLGTSCYRTVLASYYGNSDLLKDIKLMDSWCYSG